MRAVLTGAAGFIGSHLAQALLRDGHEVVGLDCFTDYYDQTLKRSNIEAIGSDRRFELVEADLRTADLAGVLDGVDVIFHLAAQPGVRLSWGEFATYDQHNVLATQRLLEAARTASIQRFVYASSSSVYGNARTYPTTELDVPRPHSPYGVTKLAGEHLASLYADNWAVPTVSLRLFTVYGPRQRPDMAIHRLIEAGLGGPTFPLFGDGTQVRDFTYVEDVVDAFIRAAEADVPFGSIFNVAGGSVCTLNELLDLVGSQLGQAVDVRREPAKPGDVERTGGAIEQATELLSWRPRFSLADGLARQVEWHVERRRSVVESDASAPT